MLRVILAVVVLLLILVAVWYWRERRGTILVSNQLNGVEVDLKCPAHLVQVMSASYSVNGQTADVTAALQKQLSGIMGFSAFVISGPVLGQPAGGRLTFRYRCGVGSSKEGFLPVPELNCGSITDQQYGVDMSFRNAAGTVVWNPYSTQSRVSLERYADTPEVATPPNPITGIGVTSAVRRMGDRYRRGEVLDAPPSQYELQPGEPGYMEAIGDDATTLIAKVARRAPGRPGTASCAMALTDQKDEYLTDGVYGEDLLPTEGPWGYRPSGRKEGFVPPWPAGVPPESPIPRSMKEGLTSTRATVQNTLTASRTGLGSVRQDPRFEPGPDWRVPGGDAAWSQGGNAGGPTGGAYAPAVFAPPANFYTQYVYGYGDPNDLYGTERHAEVVVEEPATWTH